ncbi:hypothetical protein F4821DRAFT_260780 [Hypoxylon rubiginosum]|uniref:Uncharacterized protein n=1 Tax=Hypoxylon rubiginosum TaxID=110542 RepID=A0ACC0CZX3_9PEZI|nr:hypothetical protein F4821DRAFT_260780 [Hypoxylon rubiginosum]
MAILQEVPGVAVTIRVNDVDCVEYDDPNASEQPLDKPTSSKYIESPDDAEYTIHIKIDSAYDWSYKNHMMGVTAASDGLHISSDVFTKDNEVTERDISAREEFCQDTNHWHSRKPMFSRVKIVNNATEERIESDNEMSEKLGLIEVHVIRVTNDGQVQGNNDESKRQARASVTCAEESVKGKAISHGTVFSAAERIQEPEYLDLPILDEDMGPIAVFLFRYRSKEALQQELIIPAAPRNLDGYSEAELRRLASERLDQIDEEKVEKVKKERKFVKREAGEIEDLTQDDRPSKLSRTEPVFIDLTDD